MEPTVHRVRRHRPWTTESDEELRRLIAAGKFLPEIARLVGRTQEACRTRANILKVPVRSSERARRVGIRGDP
ncbi:hypothetical protein [Sphingomonas profundi]|uniref:hypothetical protein n=1 Tax=Alterirhizorhabdus profundi TaxID=2681549 RepID=UPI0012E972F4|nr:hypothetical protein [Sphingomonas profundi]